MVELEKLCPAIRQQHYAGHEVMPVGQLDVQNISSRHQARHPKNTEAIGGANARILTTIANLDQGAGKSLGVHCVNYAADQFRRACRQAVCGQKK